MNEDCEYYNECKVKYELWCDYCLLNNKQYEPNNKEIINEQI